MSEEKKIEEMEKDIAELEKKKEEMIKSKKADPEIPEIVGIVPDTPENQKIMEDNYTPPDPMAEIIKPQVENYSPIHIVWIDNRYHINGIRGTGSGNKIIVRSLSDIDRLVVDLLGAVKNFKQSDMINTKTQK